MILRSIRLAGWRCFVEPIELGGFSERITVVYAPNGTGKSTLFDALLRALVDSHRVSGRDAEAFRPWGRDLTPTVSVAFAHGEAEYRVTKQFLDRSSSLLERLEGGRFARIAEADAADQWVRDLVTRNPPGRGLARPDNWGFAQVLWAPQGKMALGPLTGDVVADIRATLGTEVAGPGGGALETRIEELYFEVFTPGGKQRTGKGAPAVVRLREEVNEAQERVRLARERYVTFEESARRVEDLRARRAEVRRTAEAVGDQLQRARTLAAEYTGLQADARRRSAEVEVAETRHRATTTLIAEIRSTRHDIDVAQGEVRACEAELPLRAREVEELERAAAEATRHLDDVRQTRGDVDRAEDLAERGRRYVETRRLLEEQTARLKRIADASRAVEKRQQDRAALVAPDTSTLRTIRKAIKDRDDAQVRLDAALITLQILPERDGDVVIVAAEAPGARPLRAGTPLEVKGAPEVVVDLPGVARIRARGPAGSVVEIREALEMAARNLRSLTEGFATEDLDTLESLAERARVLDARVTEAETQLQTLLGSQPVEEIVKERARVGAVVQEHLEAEPSWGQETPDVERLGAEALRMKRGFIAAVEAAESRWSATQTSLTAAVEARTRLDTTVGETRRRISMLQSRLDELARDGRSDADRDADLREAALEWDAARGSLEIIERRLAEFGGDPAETARSLERQLSGLENQAVAALEEEMREEGRLERLSADGPYSALASAEEDLATLERDYAEEAVRVDAIRLLRDTVATCRAEVLAAVARPVETAATRTLERIAGTRLGRVRLGDSFDPTAVEPAIKQGGVPVDEISGGEQEQVYLAVRLALADVLARDQRQLVVLDDVLAATDAGRLARAVVVLDEAADRLQIVVLTCHPERYRGLSDASFIDLERLIAAGS